MREALRGAVALLKRHASGPESPSPPTKFAGTLPPMSLPLRPVLFCLVFAAGCTVQTQAVPDAEPPQASPPAAQVTAATTPNTPPAPPPESPCGPRPDSGCAAHDGKGHCSDALQRHECRGSAWTCPGGTISTSECKCLGKPRPGCTCGDKGWVCVEPTTPK